MILFTERKIDVNWAREVAFKANKIYGDNVFKEIYLSKKDYAASDRMGGIDFFIKKVLTKSFDLAVNKRHERLVVGLNITPPEKELFVMQGLLKNSQLNGLSVSVGGKANEKVFKDEFNYSMSFHYDFELDAVVKDCALRANVLTGTMLNNLIIAENGAFIGGTIKNGRLDLHSERNGDFSSVQASFDDRFDFEDLEIRINGKSRTVIKGKLNNYWELEQYFTTY